LFNKQYSYRKECGFGSFVDEDRNLSKKISSIDEKKISSLEMMQTWFA